MKTFLLFVSVAIAAFANAQYPKGLSVLKSPHKKASTTIGLGEVEVDYHAPSKRGREIWGDLVPYDTIWRLGANAATTLRTSTPIMIGSKMIPADTFALFLIPSSDGEWTIVLNEVWDQWGTYDYDVSKDVARIKVAAVELSESTEQLEIGVREFEEGTGTLWIKWGNIVVAPLLSVIVVDQFMGIAPGVIEQSEKASRWASYLSAAEFLVNKNENLTQAAEWINKAETEYIKFGKKYSESENNDFYLGHILWTEAKIYYAMGKKNKAIKIAKEVIANTSDNSYFTRRGGENRENIASTVSAWKD